MKKLFMIAALGATVLLGSCSKNAEGNEQSGNALKSKIENCTNPDSMKVYVNDIQAYAQKLVDEGKVAEAKEYLEKVMPIVKEKAPQLAATLEGVMATVEKIPGAAVDGLKDAAGNAVDSIGARVDAAKETVTNTATEVVENAKEAAGEAVNNVKNGAVDAATGAAESATRAINNALGK